MVAFESTNKMTNTGDKALEALSSGYVLWPDGGYIFGIPGLEGLQEGPATGALAAWSAFYDKDWAFGLHARFDDRINNGARDRYLLHDLAAGESRQFEAWLQVNDRGELAPFVSSAIDLEDLPASKRYFGFDPDELKPRQRIRRDFGSEWKIGCWCGCRRRESDRHGQLPIHMGAQ